MGSEVVFSSYMNKILAPEARNSHFRLCNFSRLEIPPIERQITLTACASPAIVLVSL